MEGILSLEQSKSNCGPQKGPLKITGGLIEEARPKQIRKFVWIALFRLGKYSFTATTKGLEPALRMDS